MPNPKLLIEIWSDIVCPFCYIGKRHIELALTEFKQQQPDTEVELHWRSFELDPNAPKLDPRPMSEILSQKYGRSLAETDAMTENMKKMGASVGLTMNMRGVKRINTFDLHRLLHFAASQGLQSQLKEVLMQAYFVDNLDLSQSETVLALAEKAGLSPTEAQQVLDTDQFAKEVRADQALGREYGIQGVPFFVFNQSVGVSGAQPVSILLQALQQSTAT